MKVVSTSYKLTKIDGKYAEVIEALRCSAMLHSVVGNTEQFLYDGGKLTLELRSSGDETFLDIKRTSRKEPKWVKSFVKHVGGKWSGSYESGTPDKLIALFAKSE